MAPLHLLDNIMWNSLVGPHAKFAAGAGGARRYAPGFSPIAGFEDPHHPDLDALAAVCDPGERFYTSLWQGTPPPGWQVEAEATMFQMVWDAPAPSGDFAPASRPLGARDVDAAVALATLTKPGPFGPRTIEMGEYFGLFEGDRLVAMAGERMHAGSLHEVSGVCTHPDLQGRGLARELMLKVVQRQMSRGETTFLHVMSANAGAIGLYEKIGFRKHREIPVRVIAFAR